MDIKSIWNKSKILFFLALPLIALIFFKDILLSLLISGGHKDLKDANKRDKNLSDKAADSNTEAEKLKVKSETIKKQAEVHKQKAANKEKAAADIDEDANWHRSWDFEE